MCRLVEPAMVPINVLQLWDDIVNITNIKFVFQTRRYQQTLNWELF